MMNKERDIWDDSLRLKLQDIEEDTAPGDWESIARRLPQGKIVTLRRRMYWAAAVLAVLLSGGGSIYLSLLTDTDTIISQVGRPDVPVAAPVVPVDAPGAPPLLAMVHKEMTAQPTLEIIPDAPTTGEAIGSEENVLLPADQQISADVTTMPADVIAMPAGVATIPAESPIVSRQKWGFGMGLGGLTQNSGEVVNTYVLRSSNYIEDEELLALNAASDQNQGKLPRTNVKHKTPISFGLSASRTLNNRFSIQTGLVYSLLVSDWETQGAYNNKTRQTLHFVGVPLSLSYKIAEWNRFHVYASAGAMGEINVVGRLKVKRFSNSLQTGVSYGNQRMKEWQWSVNARAGVSYPLIPYISAFAEIGAAYYFDNRSDVETIYSDKPLNVNPQIGFRLSF
ncbi:MAG: PorT family protein [Tannerellaceae bacterium]|jgi:hypothetical protein|nr:PorT family protein [Tannerellaceae bacterium]